MPVSTETFVKRLIDSGLMSADEVRSLQGSFPPEKLQGDDAQELARELVRQRKLTRYQATALYNEKGQQLVLGNYIILEMLGQGGMGVVLKAEHRRMKRVVALKVLSPKVITTPSIVQRFHREVEAAAKLDHPNIVAALDADEARGTHFLVMQYIEGSDLATIVKNHGPIPIERAVNYILQAAQGLEYAHCQGITHRDVKPANLLLDKQGTVKILDMGLARIEGSAVGSGQADLTNTGAVMGTVDYMSPEQALDTKRADARSDIYSLGCSLYFLLTGRAVYDGDTLIKKILAHREQAVPPLTLAGEPVPAELDTIFRKMVAKDPADRHSSMSQVIRELKVCQTSVLSKASARELGSDRTTITAQANAPDALQKFTEFIVKGNSPQSTGGSATNGDETLAHSRAELETLASIPHRPDPTTSAKRPHRAAVAAGAVILLTCVCLGALWISSFKPSSKPEARTTQSRSADTAPGNPEKRVRSPAPEVADKSIKPAEVDEPQTTVADVASKLEWLETTPRTTPVAAPLTDHVDLLALVDPERDRVVGSWQMDGGSLTFDRNEGPSRLQIPVVVPEEYRLSLELERLEGTDSFVVGLPIGGAMTILILDGESGRISGVNSLDGKPYENNALTRQGSTLSSGSLHKLTCIVRKRELTILCDGRQLIGWSGDPVRLAGSSTTWSVPHQDRPFVGGWQTGFRIRRMDLAPPEHSADDSVVKLVVGTGPGELPDLKGAFDLAKPGSVILIRHRGPLEFSATDLTGKTPLTIAGDRSSEGVDYWPIIRQAPGESNAPVAGMFHADRMNLTLQRVHLAIGGPNRPPVESVFSLATGRIELDTCSVTVGEQANEKNLIGPAFPLVRNTGQVVGSIELALVRSFARGSRLEGCLNAKQVSNVKIVAKHLAWAGGAAPWLSAREITGSLDVNLEHCTLYNLSSFVDWQSSGQPDEGMSVSAKLVSQRSLFVGTYANQAPFLTWNTPNKQPDLPRAVAEKQVTFDGKENVFHRFTSFYVDPKKKERADITKWRMLWSRTQPVDAREGDPHFRVWPTDTTLTECTPRDLQPRFWRQKQRAREFDFPLGANPSQLPPALARLFDRPPAATIELAAQPRGVPRVLVVNQKTGPYQTLEAAFSKVQDDEIIEVADDATYIPSRNFSVAQAQAVLSSHAENLTVRAAEGRHPVIVMRDDLQQGKLPVFHSDGGPRNMALFILEAGGASLQLDGLHFRVALMKGTPHGLIFAPVAYLRMSNCTGIDVSGAPAAAVHAYDPLRFIYHSGVAGWFENLLLHAPSVSDGTIRPSQSTETQIRLDGRQLSREYQIRNCVFSAGGIGIKAIAMDAAPKLSITRSTFVGQVAYLTAPKIIGINCQENLVICAANPILLEPSSAPSSSSRGSNNALWFTSKPLTAAERNTGANSLLPGPLLKVSPIPEGPSSPKDPLKRYRLKRGQPAATLAADGGPVGVRTEYFPDIPAIPPDFFR